MASTETSDPKGAAPLGDEPDRQQQDGGGEGRQHECPADRLLPAQRARQSSAFRIAGRGGDDGAEHQHIGRLQRAAALAQRECDDEPGPQPGYTSPQSRDRRVRLIAEPSRPRRSRTARGPRSRRG